MKRLCIALFLLVAAGLPAKAWYSKGYLPSCSSWQVIASVQQKLAYANRVTFHWGVGIQSVTDVRELSPVIRNTSLINRRYCRGTAWLSNGKRSDVFYLIESKQGFVSLGWRVESCLPAYDPWHVYGSWCRAVEP